MEQSELDDMWRRLDEDNQILDRPQFAMSDVVAITGATKKAIEHFLEPSRGFVRLMGDNVNPGTGRRRLFNGRQAIMIKTAFVMSRIGFPQRWSVHVTEMVADRAANRICGLATGGPALLVTYPLDDGEWAFWLATQEPEEAPDLPVAVQTLEVDRFIDETLEQLRAIVTEAKVPEFKTKRPVDEDPYSPKVNFFRAWTKDEAGRWCYVGLDAEETAELMTLQGSALKGDELVLSVPPRLNDADSERYLDLFNKHERARLRAVGAQAKGD